MQGTQPPTFSPTVWPAEPPGLPPVRRWLLDHLGTGAANVIDVARNREDVELPPDFVLREVREASDDDGALLTFMRDWGLLTDLGDQAASVPASMRAATVAMHRDAVERYPRRHPGYVVSLELARMRLRTLRALAEHVLGHRNGDDAAVLAAWPANGWEQPRHIDEAWRWWQEYVNAALYPFRMHVLLNPGDARNLALTMPTPNLYNAAVLQLTQYLGGGPIAPCANERCRRPFTVQRGTRRRYEGTAHTTGVRYCSALCAKAQSERDRRRRRKAESK